MKRILVSCIGTDLGGVEKSLIEFLRFLSTQNCEIDLLLWRKPGELFDQLPNCVTVLERVSPQSLLEVLKIKKFIPFIRQLLWLLITRAYGALFKKPWRCFLSQRKHYDIAISYCHNGYSPYYTIDKVTSDKKFLWYHHGNYDISNKEYKIDLKYYRKYDRIVAVSASCRDMLQSVFPECCISVVRNILDVAGICSLSNEDIDDIELSAKKIYVTVSRYSYEKGIDIAIKSARLLKKSGLDFCWYFIGDGEYRAMAEHLIDEYELHRECILLGSRKNPYPYIKRADVYVQPSRVESFGISVAEALILRKPTIITNIPALVDIAKGSQLVKCVEIDENSLSRAIIDIENVDNRDIESEDAIKLWDNRNREIFQEIRTLLEI